MVAPLLVLLLVVVGILTTFDGTLVAASPLTAEKIIASRQKKAQQVQDALAQLHIQLDNHRSGTKPLEGNRLKSVQARIERYEDELAEWARDLSDDELEEMIADSELEEL